MSRLKKRSGLVKALPLLLALALLAAACGSDEDDGTDAASTTTEAPATETTAAATTAPAETTTEAPAPVGGFERPQTLADNPVVFSNIAQTPTLDPAVGWGSDSMLFIRSAYDTLTEFPPGAQPAVERPVLANSWTLSDDKLTYTFELREDVTFHDGTTLDSEDVVKSLERILAINQGPATPLRGVDSFEAVDPGTVTVTLTEPNVFFTGSLPQVPIVSSEAIEANATADDPWAEAWFAENEAGSGPYELESLESAQITLSGYTDYWREFEPGTPTHVTLRTDPDVTTAVLLMCQGEIDMIGGIGPDQAQQAVDCDGVKGIIQDRFSVRNINFNLGNPDSPVADIKVREAISAAFDYQSWIDFYNGQAAPSRGPLPENAEIGPLPDVIEQDLDRARTLLEEAGYPGGEGLKVTFAAIQGLGFEEFFGTLLEENLKEVGVELEQILVPWPQLVELTANPETAADMNFFINSMTSSDPSTILKSSYSTENFASGGGFNWAYYSNDFVDEQLAGVSGIEDPVERGEALAAISQQIIDDRVAIWLGADAIFQPVLEKWDALYEPLDFTVQVRFFFARNTDMQ